MTNSGKLFGTGNISGEISGAGQLPVAVGGGGGVATGRWSKDEGVDLVLEEVWVFLKFS